MTAYKTTRRFATALVLAALLVMAVATGAVAADGASDTRGWERTTVATGKTDGGQVTQTTSSQYAPRGWEATSAATGTSPRVAVTGEPVSRPATPFMSPTLLMILGLAAAALVGFGAARVLRPHGRPHGVA